MSWRVNRNDDLAALEPRLHSRSGPGACLGLDANSEQEPALNLPRRTSSVVLKELPEGAILFSTEREEYFSLNSVGLQVWRLLASDCSTIDEVVATIQRDYPDVSRETIAADVHELLADFGGNGLVEFTAAR